MSRKGVNKVILIGNLGADPETRYSAGGTAIANVRLATSESWRDKQSGETRERTEWHRVAFYARLAEVVGQYLRKGSKIYVEGRLQTRKWQGDDGQDRYTTQIVANEMQMLDGAQSDGHVQPQQQAAPQQGQPQQRPAPQQGQPQQRPVQQQPQGQPQPAQGNGTDFFDDDLDDDIPF